MPSNIFDTHSHYTSRQFSADRDELLAALPAKGVVGVCDQAIHSANAREVLELAHRYDYICCAVGIHPESLIEEDAATLSVYHGDWRAELRDMAPLFEDPKVVAVGEAGLDHHWPIPAEEQYALFEAQLRLALELDKPIVVHDREAHAEVYELLKKYKPKGVVHCFSGSAEDALWIARQGMFIGFGGGCTFKGAKRAVKALQALSLENIVLETDCPYMAPEPLRGTRCDSSLISYVGEFIAGLKGVRPEEVFDATCQNAKALYQL